MQPSAWLTLLAVGQPLAGLGYEVPFQAGLKVLVWQCRRLNKCHQSALGNHSGRQDNDNNLSQYDIIKKEKCSV